MKVSESEFLASLLMIAEREMLFSLFGLELP
jgi:hypothetical protein